MYLTVEEMIPYVHNALKTEIDEQGRLRFFRFTQDQVSDYAADGDTFPVRCRASANVTLDLITDASWIGFEYDLLPGSSQSFYSIDLFVDQVLYATRMAEDFKSSALLFELPQGTHRVTIFMPWSAEIMIRNPAISDYTVLKPIRSKRPRILVIGDSISQGYIARHSGCTWVGKVTRDLDAEVLNWGIGAYGFYLKSLDHLPEWHPDLILLAYGTNDYAMTPTRESYRQRAFAYIEKLTVHFPSVPILMILPIYRHDEKSIFRERSREYTYRDVEEILCGIAAGYPQINVMKDMHYPHTHDFFAPDYVHPNDMGFLIHGEQVVRTVERLYPHLIR